MKYVPMLDLMREAKRGGYAVPAFACWNAEIISVVLRTAQEMSSPVILMAAPVDLDEIQPEEYGKVAYAVAEQYDVPAALLLDHGDTMERVKRCMASGFTAVMLDYSTRPYAENATALREVVKLAEGRGITVEGEIGAVGRVDDITTEGAHTSALTNPDEAKQYVEETGIDVLAVGIGNAHGNYTTLPTLDFGLLERIGKSTGIPLVLHGGSGTPAEDLARAIALGICKVNVASELVASYKEAVLHQWQNSQNLWISKVFGEATRQIPDVLRRWMTKLDSAGKA
jgi:ketose-bisphosphate aldolase